MKVTKVSLEKKSLEKLLFKREQVGFPERKCLRSHLCSASNSFIGPLVLLMDGTAGGQLTGADGVPVCLLSAAYNEIRKWQLTWYRVVFKTDCF